MRKLPVIFWLIAAIAIGWGFGAIPLFEPPVGNLEGRVVARDSGRPLLAQVVLSPEGASLMAHSDADGHFSFPGVSTGMYRLEISSPGHYLGQFPAYVTEGRTASVDIEVPRRPSWVELVIHYNLVYPGEPVSVAARGLTLTPNYHLDVCRINRWRRVSEYEAREYQKALAAAIAAGDLTLVSSADHPPRHIDPEGVYYDRLSLGQLPLGRYLLVATSENGSRSTERLTISRLALLVKSDTQQAVAYVADLKSGHPIAGARVTVSGADRRSAAATAVTDANGLARLPKAQNVERDITYTASVGDDVVSLSAWHPGWANEGYRLFAFTDRPIYRPGDLVRFKGVLRAQQGLEYRVPAAASVVLAVTGEDGTEIYRSRYQTNDQGSFAGSFTLPKLAKAGTYTMTSTVGKFRDETFVTVASYLKPELQLSARPVKPQYVRGELAQVEIQASYYFGAPASDLDVRWTLTRSPHYPSAEVDEEWEGEEGDFGGEMVSNGEGKTDADGRLRLTLPSRLATGEQGKEENPYFDHEFHLEVWSTSDAGGEAQASTSYLVTRGRFSLAISLERYVLTPGKPTGLKVEARDFSGHPVADQQITLALLTETQPRRQPGKVKRTTIASWSARTDRDGVAQTSVTAPKQGEFLIEGVARDGDDHHIAVREHLWAAAGPFWEFGERWSEISIVSDRREYGERDRVRLLITSQHAGPGLLCLEGVSLYDVRPISLRQGANLIEFDLKPEYVPNLFAWVGQVYDKQLHRAEHEIRVSRETRRLVVKVKPGQSEYRPGKPASCDVQVTDAKGRPAQAEVAVGVVDEAIYALAKDNVADPAEFFYGRHYNSVQTSFEPEGYYLGGSDKAPTNIEVRRRFEDTAYWSPQVLTDPQGLARVRFRLPDNLTSWRVTVRAVSADTRGGTGRADFKVNKPLMVRLDLPRFATQGDRFRVSAYVHNDTGAEQRVQLHSWARGLKLESRDQEMRVPAHQAVREDWWATAIGLDRVVIGASGVGGKLNDAVELTLPVNPLTRTQFDAWSGRTEGEADVVFPLRQDAYRERARLTISVAPSVAASLFSSLGYLVHYPYGCVEQTISSFLPGLSLHDLLVARGLDDSPVAKSIPPMVRDGLARLSALRREEDGWGWGRWGELDIWMTSYALLALEEAKTAGYQAPARGMARERLESALRTQRFEYPDDLAFSAYVLARLKSESTVPTLLRALHHPKLSGRGRALCALAYFERGNIVEAHRVMAEVWRTAKHEGDWTYWTGLQSQECTWWDGGATIEATAWSLQAALRADPGDPRIASVAGWLLHARIGDHWVSTRDTAIALAALAAYLRRVDEPNPAYTAVVRLNGEEVLRRTYTSDLKTWREASVEVPTEKLRPGVNRLVFSRGSGAGLPAGRVAGRLYYLVNLRQQVQIREDQKTAEGQTLQIQREYFKLAKGTSAGSLGYGPAARPGDTFQENDRVQVRLTINSSQRLRYVLIEDPLPAGLEPSARGDVGFMDWRSWWVDNDVRDDRVNFYVDWLPAGKRTIEYIVTTRTPGRFHAPPPNGFTMYQPKINAVGAQAVLEVRP